MNPSSPLESSDRWIEKRLEGRALRPRAAAYIIAIFWGVAVVVIGVVEWLIDPKTFHTVWLGLWWAVETVTTVGYGDIVPKQTAGKIIAAFLMLGGLSLLSVITAAITSGFVSRAEAQREASSVQQPDPVLQRLDELALQLTAIRTQLGDSRPSSPPDGPGAPGSPS